MNRSLARTIIVVASAAVVIGMTLPNMFLGNFVTAYSGLSVDTHYDVVSVAPGSLGDRAGLRVGDHIEPSSLSSVGRLDVSPGEWYIPKVGETIPMVVDRAGQRLALRLESPPNPTTNGVAVVKRTTATLFIIVAAVLLLLRPSVMLWGFFLYALGSTNGGATILEFVSPSAATIGNCILAIGVYNVIGPLGFLVFATRFPERSERGFRRRVDALIPALAVLLALAAFAEVLYVAGVELPRGTDFFINGAPGIALTAGILALIAGFVQLRAPQRQRLRWVVAGFAVYYAATLYSQLIAPYLPMQGWPPSWTNAGWTSDVLNGLVIFIPLTVAYAAMKHHVLDLNFVIGRGLVYGIITSIAVAIFAAIDWFIGGVLAQTKLATVGEFIAAIAIGVWLNGLQSRVNRFVDAVIFRRRHLAEQRLRRVAAGLPHADTIETVSSMLTAEPVDALGLVSAAFFRRRDDRAFYCELALGIPRADISSIGVSDRLAVHLQGERGPVFLHQIGWRMVSAADPASMPVLACPIFVRHQLRAIVLYGGHKTGEAIDPDEIRAIESICVGASAAIDHLEAQELASQLQDSQRSLALAQQDAEMLRTALAAAAR